MTQTSFGFVPDDSGPAMPRLIEVICKESTLIGADAYLFSLGLDDFKVEDVGESDGNQVLNVLIEGCGTYQQIVLPRGFRAVDISRDDLFEQHETVSGFSGLGWDSLEEDGQVTLIGPESKIRALEALLDDPSANRAVLREQLKDVSLI